MISFQAPVQLDLGDGASVQAGPPASTPSDATDWRLCCLCQKKIPGVSIRVLNDITVYQRLSVRLSTLQDLDSLPFGLKTLKRLIEGDCLADTLFQKSAGWQKNVVMTFAMSKRLAELGRENPHLLLQMQTHKTNAVAGKV